MLAISQPTSVAVLLLATLAVLRPAAGSRSVLEGPLQDCCCDATTIETANHDIFLLSAALVRNTTFFKTFRVDLYRDCPHWADDSACVRRDCTVCVCEDDQVPSVWRQADKEMSSCHPDPLNDVDFTLDSTSKFPQTNPASWALQDNPSSAAYVDLTKNPERFTGYDGPSTQRIWSAVYDENCFAFAKSCPLGICPADACVAERVLVRLISGIHTSISMHIAAEYFHPGPYGIGGRWAENFELYQQRVGNHRDRIGNLYFTMAVVIRALSKASASLSPATYNYKTGDQTHDAITKKALGALLAHPLIDPRSRTCRRSPTFDEHQVFSEDPEAPQNLQAFRAAFLNISSIMDCVGCEKCRLWGKLQFLGLGTALKILFSTPDGTPIFLERNEVVALINLVNKLSGSIEQIHSFEKLELERLTLARRAILLLPWLVPAAVFLASVIYLARWLRS